MSKKYSKSTWLKWLSQATVAVNTRQAIATSLSPTGFLDSTRWEVRAHLLPVRLPIAQRDQIAAVGAQVAGYHTNNAQHMEVFIGDLLDVLTDRGIIAVHRKHSVHIQISMFSTPSNYQFAELALHVDVDGKRRKLRSGF